jgi:hypothetical protein
VEDAQNFRRWCGVFGKRLGFGGLLMWYSWFVFGSLLVAGKTALPVLFMGCWGICKVDVEKKWLKRI